MHGRIVPTALLSGTLLHGLLLGHSTQPTYQKFLENPYVGLVGEAAFAHPVSGFLLQGSGNTCLGIGSAHIGYSPSANWACAGFYDRDFKNKKWQGGIAGEGKNSFVPLTHTVHCVLFGSAEIARGIDITTTLPLHLRPLRETCLKRLHLTKIYLDWTFIGHEKDRSGHRFNGCLRLRILLHPWVETSFSGQFWAGNSFSFKPSCPFFTLKIKKPSRRTGWLFTRAQQPVVLKQEQQIPVTSQHTPTDDSKSSTDHKTTIGSVSDHQNSQGHRHQDKNPTLSEKSIGSVSDHQNSQVHGHQDKNPTLNNKNAVPPENFFATLFEGFWTDSPRAVKERFIKHLNLMKEELNTEHCADYFYIFYWCSFMEKKPQEFKNICIFKLNEEDEGNNSFILFSIGQFFLCKDDSDFIKWYNKFNRYFQGVNKYKDSPEEKSLIQWLGNHASHLKTLRSSIEDRIEQVDDEVYAHTYFDNM